jgi:hypothetical protein
MNVGIGTEATQFLIWEHINWIFGTVRAASGGRKKNRDPDPVDGNVTVG